MDEVLDIEGNVIWQGWNSQTESLNNYPAAHLTVTWQTDPQNPTTWIIRESFILVFSQSLESDHTPPAVSEELPAPGATFIDIFTDVFTF